MLREGAAIIDYCIELQQQNGTKEVPQLPHEEALFQRLQAAEVAAEMIKRIFVDLVIAAGDTVGK